MAKRKVTVQGLAAPSGVRPLADKRYQFAVINRDPRPAPPVNYNTSYPWLPYDTDNLYPEKKVRPLLLSATHNAILQAKSYYTIREGLEYDRELDPARTAFLDRIGGGYGVDKLLRLAAFDLACYGGFAWQVISEGTGARIRHVKHLDYPKVRIANPNRNAAVLYEDSAIRDLIEIEGDDIGLFYLSANWEYYSNQDFRPLPIVAFDAERMKRVQMQGQPASVVAQCPYLYYYNTESPIIDYYSTPDYLGGMTDIDSEIQISIFHNSNIRNGFVPTGVLTIPDDPDDEEKKATLERVRQDYIGAGNAGNLLVLFGVTDADGRAQEATFTPVSTTNNADIYHTTSELIVQKILTAHRLPSPTLAGLAGAGGLGGNASELKAASSLFYNTVIKGYQAPLLDAICQMLEVNGFETKDIRLSSKPPLEEEVSESLLRELLTFNEWRERIGYPETAESPLTATSLQAYMLMVGDPLTTDQKRRKLGESPLTDEDLTRDIIIANAIEDGIPPPPPGTPPPAAGPDSVTMKPVTIPNNV